MSISMSYSTPKIDFKDNLIEAALHIFNTVIYSVGLIALVFMFSVAIPTFLYIIFSVKNSLQIDVSPGINVLPDEELRAFVGALFEMFGL